MIRWQQDKSYSFFGRPEYNTVLGIKGKYGAVPRNVWVYFLFWGVRPTFAALTKKATKRVCMGEIPNYRIWGAPDFYLIPSTAQNRPISMKFRVRENLNFFSHLSGETYQWLARDIAIIEFTVL